MAIYLLAQGVFWGFDGLVDLRLDTQSVRGAVARCFELIDAPAAPVTSVADRRTFGRSISSTAASAR
jgi:hypothetical protein